MFDVVLFVFLPQLGKGGGERVFSCCNLTLRKEDSLAQRENGSTALSHRPQVNHWGDIRPRKLKMEFAKIELFLGTTASLQKPRRSPLTADAKWGVSPEFQLPDGAHDSPVYFPGYLMQARKTEDDFGRLHTRRIDIFHFSIYVALQFTGRGNKLTRCCMRKSSRPIHQGKEKEGSDGRKLKSWREQSKQTLIKESANYYCACVPAQMAGPGEGPLTYSVLAQRYSFCTLCHSQEHLKPQKSEASRNPKRSQNPEAETIGIIPWQMIIRLALVGNWSAFGAEVDISGSRLPVMYFCASPLDPAFIHREVKDANKGRAGQILAR